MVVQVKESPATQDPPLQPYFAQLWLRASGMVRYECELGTL